MHVYECISLKYLHRSVYIRLRVYMYVLSHIYTYITYVYVVKYMQVCKLCACPYVCGRLRST